MSISKKWILNLFRAESMAHAFLHDSKIHAVHDMPVYAQAQFENFRDAKRACVYAARKIMCE